MRLASLILWIALAACGDDAGTEPPIDMGVDLAVDLGARSDGAADAMALDSGLPAMRIDIGTGQLDYVPLPEDRTIELVQGSQGGVHLDLALRIWGLEANDLALRYEGTLADTGEEVFLPVERVLNPDRVLDAGDHLVRAGDRLILDEALLRRADLVGREVRVEVTATPPEGDPVVASRSMIVIDER